MSNINSPDTDFEKKTERLDIRLSHQKKQAFVEACDNQGDTPSNAVRRFITTYVRREHRDEITSSLRFSNWKRNLGAGAIGATVCLAIAFVWNYTTVQNQKSRTVEAFKVFDGNENGVIELGEIALNDMDLHRVLNIDGVEGISKEEFQLKGKMVWSYVDPNSFEILEDKQSRFKQTSVVRTIISKDGKPIDHDGPIFIQVGGDMVEVPKGMSVEEFIKSQNIEPDEIPARVEMSPAMRERLQKFSAKVVTFDLRNPAKVQINIFEQQVSELPRSSIVGHERSVSWAAGRKTPEFVMGTGRQHAVLTKTAQP